MPIICLLSFVAGTEEEPFEVSSGSYGGAKHSSFA